MSQVNEKVLKNKIEQGDLSNCYLFYGQEDFLIKKAVNKIISTTIADNLKDFNYSRFFGENLSWDKVEDMLNMAPVFSEKRIVWLDGVHIDKFLKKDMDIIKRCLKNIPNTSILIITVADSNLTTKNCLKLKQLAGSCSKIGEVVEFLFRSDGELLDIVSKYVSERGGAISRSDILFLINRCGRSLKVLTIELDKICSYAGKREILREDILKLTTPNIESSVFDIAKNILQGNKKNAIIILDDLINSQVQPLVILGALGMCFIDIYRAKCVMSSGKDEKAILDFYDYRGKEFRIRNAIKNCSKYSMSRLRRCVLELSDVDVKCKTTSLDQKMLIEKLILSVM